MNAEDRNKPSRVLPIRPDALPSDPLSTLYLRYRLDVIDFVRRKFGPGPPEPEDVAQAVFLQIAAQGHPDSIENPRSFLLKTAQNLVLDHRRRHARRQGSADEFEARSANLMSDFDAERVVTGKERLKMLMQVLSRLPPNKQQMVLLSRLHGWSCEQIGRHFGTSAEAVQKQIERVLKECLTTFDAERGARQRLAGGITSIQASPRSSARAPGHTRTEEE